MTHQRALSALSADIKVAMLDLSTAHPDVTREQIEKLSLARTQILNAADNLHSVAAELVGDLKAPGPVVVIDSLSGIQQAMTDGLLKKKKD